MRVRLEGEPRLRRGRPAPRRAPPCCPRGARGSGSGRNSCVGPPPASRASRRDTAPRHVRAVDTDWRAGSHAAPTRARGTRRSLFTTAGYLNNGRMSIRTCGGASRHGGHAQGGTHVLLRSGGHTLTVHITALPLQQPDQGPWHHLPRSPHVAQARAPLRPRPRFGRFGASRWAVSAGRYRALGGLQRGGASRWAVFSRAVRRAGQSSAGRCLALCRRHAGRPG
jgi:hypothetical protein